MTSRSSETDGGKLRAVRRRVVGRVAAAVDRAAVMAAYAGTARARRRSRSESLGHGQRVAILGRLAKRYRSVLDSDAYFLEPRPISVERKEVTCFVDAHRVWDLRWPSAYETFLPELRERYDRKEKNRWAAARLFAHEQARPLIIIVHGYMAGQYPVEQRLWPVQWLYRRGMDVALFVLPFHGVRAIRGRVGAPPFPGSDPRFSNEGFRQAMHDLRDFVEWLLTVGAHASVGLMGMSLGAYATALAATLEPRLSFAVPVIPLTSLADFARDQGRLGHTPEQTGIEHRALDAVHQVISPLRRHRCIDADRVLIVGAAADRITPIAHAHRLAEHFESPMIQWSGGHLLQLGRAGAFRRIGRFLGDLGMFQP